MKQVRISQVDALFSNGTYSIEFLFYFKEGLDPQKIRQALEKLSTAFWPMFGKYNEGIISFDRYQKEDFFLVETVDRKFTIPAAEKERWAFFAQYKLPDTKKLSHFKITQFKNGRIIVAKMNHLAGDGYSYFYFLATLAVLSRQTLLPSKQSVMRLFSKPHHRRTTLKEFTFKRPVQMAVQQSGQFAIAADEILRKDVQSLIRKVGESKNYRISTNDVLSAMALKKLVGAQKEFAGESVELTIPIDVRRQVKDYGRRFFGNGIMLHTMKLRKDDIKKWPIEETAVLIRKGMPGVTKHSYLDYLIGLEEIFSKGIPEKWRPFDPTTGCLVTNISRLPIDNLNFGKGTPDFIFPLTVEKNAAAVMAKNENFVLRSAL